MTRWGIYLIIFGVISFVLPYLGLQLKLISVFGEAAPYIGGGLIVIGGILVVVGRSKASAAQSQ